MIDGLKKKSSGKSCREDRIGTEDRGTRVKDIVRQTQSNRERGGREDNFSYPTSKQSKGRQPEQPRVMT